MDCSSSQNPIKSLSSLATVRPKNVHISHLESDFAQEFLNQNISQLEVPLQRLPWKTEFMNDPTPSLSLRERQSFENAFQSKGEAWKNEFLKCEALHTNADWEEKFNNVLKSLDQNSLGKSWEEQFKEINPENDSIDWNEKFRDIFGFNESKSDWKTEFLDSPRILDPDPVTAPSGEYVFEVDNPFISTSDPYSEGLRLLEGGQLSQAALAFEAVVQNDQSHANAWFYLGTTQAENEKEGPAILALEKSVKENPNNSPAFMSLAVSYTNEGMDLQAYMSLKRWINIEYPTINTKHNPDLLAEVTSLFLDAARNPSLHVAGSKQSLDPDVQTGLGVLFYNSGDFEKAIDCFNSALSVRPQDYKLWSRLGATLANSGNTEEAIDAYYKALKIRPTFVRGRYNLGVGCINIGCYKEAAEHFLGALSLHRQDEKANISNNLWDTLRRTFILMERPDLCDLAQKRDYMIFRNEFDF